VRRRRRKRQKNRRTERKRFEGKDNDASYLTRFQGQRLIDSPSDKDIDKIAKVQCVIKGEFLNDKSEGGEGRSEKQRVLNAIEGGDEDGSDLAHLRGHGHHIRIHEKLHGTLVRRTEGEEKENRRRRSQEEEEQEQEEEESGGGGGGGGEGVGAGGGGGGERGK